MAFKISALAIAVLAPSTFIWYTTETYYLGCVESASARTYTGDGTDGALLRGDKDTMDTVRHEAVASCSRRPF